MNVRSVSSALSRRLLKVQYLYALNNQVRRRVADLASGSEWKKTLRRQPFPRTLALSSDSAPNVSRALAVNLHYLQSLTHTTTTATAFSNDDHDHKDIPSPLALQEKTIETNPFIRPSIHRDRTSPGVAHFSS